MAERFHCNQQDYLVWKPGMAVIHITCKRTVAKYGDSMLIICSSNIPITPISRHIGTPSSEGPAEPKFIVPHSSSQLHGFINGFVNLA